MTAYRRRRRLLVYMAWVKTQPCELAGVEGAGHCWGGIEADHAGEKPGLGMKADDSTCIPLCSRHHRHRTVRDGFFRGMTREAELDWRMAAVLRTQVRYQAHRAAMEVF